MPSYDVLLYHDLKSDERPQKGQRISFDGQEWEVVSVEKRAIHGDKDGLIVCKLPPVGPAWPEGWRESEGS